MNKIITFFHVSLLGLAAAAATAQEPRTATANFVDANGDAAGDATLTETPNGLLIEFQLENVPADGVHGFHIHETGDCSAPDFESAGDHYDPLGSSHGYLEQEGYHAGDMPNQVASENGTVEASVFNDHVTLSDGRASVFDEDGSALVLHASEDDYKSQPSGDAGDRLLCAEIQRN